ncbi:flagellar motor switch phosphatase FliY [Caldibacillus lycopersici]|uniref:Flagellar motor switch phosphatase FliY n=1 Tax=Perspicuibacillus lycopersici TaxID=1325689 RepID=A0AAE3IRE4_9BACI|nr:flagellar motor switch phosphatase FliY [Perspicuibacillus lycopersici]MCU9612094.1 flagellar motor switch phosphatase FliY [Perspicuibacillus lycopersici]
MSKGMLSQEEIDALLNGASLSDLEDNSQIANSPTQGTEVLSTIEQDTLGEIGNISFGNSATALSGLLNQPVKITTPNVSVISRSQLDKEFTKPYVAVIVNYTTGFIGSNIFIINQADASVIADLMLGGDGLNPSPDFTELQLSAVQEAMNQMMGSAATSMSTIFNERVEISPPNIDFINLPEGEGEDIIPSEEQLVKVSFRLIVGELINSTLMQILPFSFAKSLVSALTDQAEKESMQSNSASAYANAMQSQNGQSFHSGDSFIQEQNQFPPTNGRTNSPNVADIAMNNTVDMKTKNVQPVLFNSFSQNSSNKEEPRNLQMLFDIPLQVTVELGRTKKLVKDILELSPGSIIELDKLAGEPVDILVNNRLIAKGEVVVIEENFGVRVTDIVSQTERINKIR